MDEQLIAMLIKIGVVVVVIIIIGVMVAKRFLYFHPSHEMLPTNEPYTEINQGTLNGRMFEGPSDKIVVYCHGNAGNLSTRPGMVSSFLKLGYSVLIFDYSGFGKSKGVPTEQQCYDDASTFIALLRQKYPAEKIVMYGTSLGAPVAIYVARRYDIPTVILESSLTSIKNVIKKNYSIFSFLSFLFPEFDMESYLKGFKGRVLMMHSQTDEMIPYESAVELQGLVTKFITITGGHNTPVIPWEEIQSFIENKQS